MTSAELERLAELGHLKREAPARAELEGLIHTGSARLDDARNHDNSPEGRLDLAYNAAHAFAFRVAHGSERRESSKEEVRVNDEGRSASGSMC